MNGTAMLRFVTTLSAAVALLGASACSNPIHGEWQSDDELANGENNELWFYRDGSGEATIFATPAGQPDNWIRFDFETEWTEFSGSVYTIELTCDDVDCNDTDDFEMECDGIKEGDGDLKLDCEGDGKWANYVFNWEKK